MHRSALVFRGAVGTAGLHMYHWVQLLRAEKGELILANAAGQTTVCRAAIIPAGVPRAIIHGTSDGNVILLPPETAAGSGLARSVSSPNSPEAWARAGSSICDQLDLDHWAEEQLLSPLQPTALMRHPAIEKTLQMLPVRIQEGTVRLREISQDVGLSESRFAHLFSAQIGMTFRPYVRCLRVTHAVELAVRGCSLTEAAHEAGFADSSHLNRACHLTLGIAPSVLTTRFQIALEP